MSTDDEVVAYGRDHYPNTATTVRFSDTIKDTKKTKAEIRSKKETQTDARMKINGQ